MKENDINTILSNDDKLREAISRREQKQPPMPAGLNDRLMQRLVQQEEQPRRRRMWWLYPAVGAVAAVGLLLLTLHDDHREVEPKKLPVVAQQAARQEAVAETAAPAPALSIIIEECPPVVAKTVKTGKKTQRREIPDTLGNSIWQHRENVVRAIQVLADCEATIVREEQEVRNDIVKATYNAMPQPANVILVTNEAGDCIVSDTNEQTIIEI